MAQTIHTQIRADLFSNFFICVHPRFIRVICVLHAMYKAGKIQPGAIQSVSVPLVDGTP